MEGKPANFSSLSPPASSPAKDFSSPLGMGGNKQTQAKKLTIKNLRRAPALPEDFQERSWGKLKRAVVAIQTATSIHTSLEELYQAVENLCRYILCNIGLILTVTVHSIGWRYISNGWRYSDSRNGWTYLGIMRITY